MTNRALIVAVVLLSSLHCLAQPTGAAPFDDLDLPIPQTPDIERVTEDSIPRPPRTPQAADTWSEESRFQVPSIEGARLALRANRIRDSLAQLETAANEDAALPPALLMLAQLYAAESRYQEGLVVLEKAAAVHKDHPEVYHLLGTVALAQGRHADAWVHFEKALLLKTPEAWSQGQQTHFKANCLAALATVSVQRRDWQSAEDMYARWAELMPPSAAMLNRWAHALIQIGQPDKAFEKLAEAHRADPSRDRPELAMGTLYMQLGEFPRASDWYEKAAAKYPDDGRVHFEHAAAALIVGQTEIASQQLDKALELGTNLDDLGANLPLLQGWIARSEQRYKEAEGFFKEVLRLSPGNATALFHLPLVLVEQTDEAKRRQALQIASIYAQKNPKSSFALTTLGWVQFRLDQPAEAEVSLMQAASGAASNGETAYYLAQVLLANGKANEAAKFVGPLRKAVDAPQIFIPREEARKWLETVALAFE